MPQFSKISAARLITCDYRLQKIFNEVIKTIDCCILEGYRPKNEQDKAFHDGKSEKKWPDSLHNRQPSLAVDAAPFPIDWNDKERFYLFAANVAAIAKRLGIGIRLGCDWNGDGIRNEKFIDLPHFEIPS